MPDHNDAPKSPDGVATPLASGLKDVADTAVVIAANRLRGARVAVRSKLGTGFVASGYGGVDFTASAVTMVDAATAKRMVEEHPDEYELV